MTPAARTRQTSRTCGGVGWTSVGGFSTRVAAVALALSLGVGVGLQPAAADDEVDDTRDSLTAALEQISTLEAEAAAAAEAHHKASADLAEVRALLARSRDAVRVQEAVVDSTERSVGQLARAAYAGGGVDESLQLLLADSAGEFFRGYGTLVQVANAQAVTLGRHESSLARLDHSERRVTDQRNRAVQLVEERERATEQSERSLAEARKVYSELESELKQRIREQRRLERQQSRALAGEASAALTDGAGIADSDLSPVLEYALAQVGKHYILGAEGPDAFDCSGLILRAYQQVGIELPRYSDYQYTAGRPVPLEEAQPGDIVFYNKLGAHHVGLYIGDGQMVHAVSPSRGIVVGSVLAPWYAERFTGVARIAG